ncbi:MAG: hypothetical protein HKN25_05700 [Pyrinomonadaceae bacterium]|nr:hypothetical protein [Pyrinomonadaceae bacterium]
MKDFEEKSSEEIECRIDGITFQNNTWLGAAIRQAAGTLLRQESRDLYGDRVHDYRRRISLPGQLPNISTADELDPISIKPRRIGSVFTIFKCRK